jgi:hypothetical protein
MNQNDIISTVEATAPDTFKIVINACFGGFSLSDEAITMFRERKGIAADERATYADELFRDDADLIAVVETLGPKKASGRYANLKVVEVPMWLQEKGWDIEEYDGSEHIAENHQTWF